MNCWSPGRVPVLLAGVTEIDTNAALSMTVRVVQSEKAPRVAEMWVVLAIFYPEPV